MVVFPNAKINIGLFVTAKRSDGFHNLETVFYPVGLSDVLEIGEGDGQVGEYTFKNTGIDVGCDPEKNLIIKAYRLLSDIHHLPSIRIHLHKLIPFGAGLGGGSADAAFMLKALNEYFELHISERELVSYASALGSDCAFFISDRPAFASGKGEILEEMALSLEGYQFVLVKPAIGVSTPEAYAGIHPQAPEFDLRQLTTLPVRAWRGKVRNDFEKSVFLKYPQIAGIKHQLYELGALYASMTGSGSAVYGIFEKDKKVNLDFPDCFVWKNDSI